MPALWWHASLALSSGAAAHQVAAYVCSTVAASGKASGHSAAIYPQVGWQALYLHGLDRRAASAKHRRSAFSFHAREVGASGRPHILVLKCEVSIQQPVYYEKCHASSSICCDCFCLCCGEQSGEQVDLDARIILVHPVSTRLKAELILCDAGLSTRLAKIRCAAAYLRLSGITVMGCPCTTWRTLSSRNMAVLNETRCCISRQPRALYSKLLWTCMEEADVQGISCASDQQS